MKRYFLHILLVGVLGMLAVSCSDEYDSMGLDSRQAQVVFSVAMDTPVSRSRAAEDKNTWGSDYAPSTPGDAYDNRIDINQFIVKIVDGEKEYKIKDIIKWKVDGAENVYKFVGVVEGIDQSTVLTNPKVYVYANMGTTEPAETFIRQDGANIPMWGVKSIQGNKTFAPGTRVDLEEIALLRAMAKLEVSLNTEMAKEFKLTGATLNKHNSTGNTLPTLPKEFKGSTEDLSLEGVFNPMTGDSQGTLALAPVVTGSSYVVYLPEVKNEELKITVQLKQKKVDPATGNVTYGSEEEGTFSLSSDVVRNHWYKYNITGFAASQIQVNYEVVDWTNVNIQLGGDGFLFLNKDLIEIYNSNIDADQLKFSSSSPIKSIVLKDSYKHYRNGEIKETPVGETGDNVYAYYMNKYGVLTQLSNEEGTDEAIVLSNINATAESGLNGGITINSPFIADNDASKPSALQKDSHDNTIRYLEFEVTNEQNLTATFRVMQYPPVVVTNEEGYFSYRSDQKYSDDQEEASHFHNYKGWQSFHLSGLMWYQIFDWTNVPYDDNEEDICLETDTVRNYSAGKAVNVPEGCEVVHYGSTYKPHAFKDNRGVVVEYNYGGLHRSTASFANTSFFRHRYLGQENTTGEYLADKNGNPKGYNNKYYHKRGDVQGLAFGPIYEEEVDGKIRRYRKKYVWNVNPIFYNLYVDSVYQDASAGRQKGQADIHMVGHDVYYGDNSGGWGSWGKTGYINHRMYHVKTTMSTSEYVIGNVELIDNEGKPTTDVTIGVTANTSRNANLISPSFMVASQLGETDYQRILNNAKGTVHTVPNVGTFYKLAVDHCREYVETTYKDENNNYKWDKGEPVTHYNDWRLPTKAEINKLIELQNTSRAMDKLLVGQYYFCAAGAGDDADPTVKENWVSNLVPGYTSGKTGYYIRCVRDVKPEGQNGFLEK